MYLKNDTSPKPIYAILVNASDGSPITSGVTAYHIQGTTRTAGAGTLTHIANGRWCYVPTQAETNYDAFAIDFYHDDAVGKGALVEIVTANQGLAIITADTSAIKQKTDAYLDATISSRAPANTALSNTVWTDTKAAFLDAAISSRLEASSYVAPDNASIASIKSKTDAYLDATVSSRLAASDYVAPDNTSISAIKSRTDAYLDAAVSSRLASSAYVAPDNSSITAIKAKTDKFTFNEDNYVYAVGVGGSGGTDWTDAEKQQIRYRLGIDGDTAVPTTNSPHLGTTYGNLDQLAAHGDSEWTKTPPADIWTYSNRTITGGTVDTVQDKDGYTLSSAGIDAIWDEAQSGHTTAGTFGAYLNTQISSRAPADTALSNLIWTNDKASYLDAAISSRLEASSYVAPDNASISAIKTQTDKFSFAGTGPYDVKATLDGEKVTVLANEDKTGYSLATADVSAIADAVWDEATSGHQTAGTYGKTSEWTTTASGVWGHTTRTLTAFGFNVTVDMSQTLPTSPGPGTVGEALKRADTLRFTGAAGEELVLASATVDVDEQAIADAIVAEIQDQNLVQVVVQPLVASVQRTDGSGGVISGWTYARLVASWNVKDVNLSGHDLRLILYNRNDPASAIVEYSTGAGEITITYNAPDSLVQINGPDTKTPPAGTYGYVLRDQTTDVVLLSGRCVIQAAPDAS